MRLTENLRLTVIPGKGGYGSTKFKLNKYRKLVFDGGNGGCGGDLIFRATNKVTLSHIYPKNKVIEGVAGCNGRQNNKKGAKGKTTFIGLAKSCSINIQFDSITKKKSINYILTEGKQLRISGTKGGLGNFITKTKSSDSHIPKNPEALILNISILLNKNYVGIISTVNRHYYNYFLKLINDKVVFKADGDFNILTSSNSLNKQIYYCFHFISDKIIRYANSLKKNIILVIDDFKKKELCSKYALMRVNTRSLN